MEMMTDRQQADRAAHVVQAHNEELVERIARAIPADGAAQPLDGVHLTRVSAPTQPLHGVYRPSLCVIAQGSKEVLLGESRLRYDPAHYLIATIELPTVSRVLEASPECPYLSLRLDLDPALVGSVMVETGHAATPGQAEARAMGVSPLDPSLLDAVVRLVRLVETPADAPILRPLITQEIVYRLLMGAQGGRLRHLTLLGGSTHRVARAVERLRHDLDQPLRIEQIAHDLGMSVSGFHHHFKAVTAMSPLQFQKQLRLQEARRLLLGEDLDAAGVAARVGYTDAAYFNREYKSLFGAPPMRDVARLRDATGTGAPSGLMRTGPRPA